MRRSNAAFRLQTPLLEEAKRVEPGELSALRTGDYFCKRASRARIGKAKRILKRAGRGKPATAGDENGMHPLPLSTSRKP